jgi:hypothetical protein
MTTGPSLEELCNVHTDLCNRLFKQMGLRTQCKLLPPPKPQEWARYAAGNQNRLPATFLEFLKLHNGWVNFAAAYMVIGVSGSHAVRTSSRINQVIKAYLSTWTRAGRSTAPEFIAKLESSGSKTGKSLEEARLFLPNLSIVAITRFGRLIAFDPRSKTAKDEMEAIVVEPGGAIPRRYPGFVPMLEYYNKSQQEQLESRAGDQAPATGTPRRRG